MPKGIRPTQGKVRKALFDILGDVEGLSFLELFAGSGAVGIEALSQGAKRVVFIESNPDCVRLLKSNLSCLLFTTYDLLAMDASRAIEGLAKKKLKFDIVFLDPPYYRDMAPRPSSSAIAQRHSGSKASAVESLAKKTLQMLSSCDILSPDGLIAVQHFKKDNLPYTTGDLVLLKQAAYGDTVLSFYTFAALK